MSIMPLVFCLSMAFAVDTDSLSSEFIHHISSINTTWEAGENFNNIISMQFFKNFIGIIQFFTPSSILPILVLETQNGYIPETFDSRVKWPHCPTISEIRDSGPCRSSWALSAAGAISDRICIHSKGEVNARISAQDLVSCCQSCGFGCKGGFSGAAWRYWVHRGIVTGGSYGSEQGCVPYKVAPCKHITNGEQLPCNKSIPPTSKCTKVCQPSYNSTYKKDLYYGKSAYYVKNTETNIQLEIMNNGPVEGSFNIYEDFLSYKKGVYQHVSGKNLGGLAVKILGWGVEKRTPYWLVANSWNTDWGENGFFRILRGKNECGIEKEVYAGLPKFHNPKYNY